MFSCSTLVTCSWNIIRNIMMKKIGTLEDAFVCVSVKNWLKMMFPDAKRQYFTNVHLWWIDGFNASIVQVGSRIYSQTDLYWQPICKIVFITKNISKWIFTVSWNEHRKRWKSFCRPRSISGKEPRACCETHFSDWLCQITCLVPVVIQQM